MDIDNSAHAVFHFIPGKYDGEFEHGRFRVTYHELRLYAVRDIKAGTVTLVEASSPEHAYRKVRGSVLYQDDTMKKWGS